MKKLSMQLLLLSGIAICAFSCKKQVDETNETLLKASGQNNGNAYGESKKLYVTNLYELYDAVNNVDNKGARVIIAPGVYVLNASYPNGGRLELQTDMALQGQPGNAEAVVIDQSALPGSSFRLTPTISVAPIRMGRGANSLEWLSVKGGAVAANPLAVIESDLVGNETHVTIAHTNVDCNGSRIGILLRNRLEEHVNRVIHAKLEHNTIANAFSNNNPPGAGLALQNRISGSKIKLQMKGNYIHGCRVGILNFNSGQGENMDHCLLEVTSYADRIEGNGCGIDMSGGSTSPALPYANNNMSIYKLYGGSIKNNGLPQIPTNNGAKPGGIFATAGYNRASNNILKAGFWACDISGNNGTDIHAYGYYSTAGSVIGSNNLFDLYLFGNSAGAIVNATQSAPAEPAGTNVLHVFRNR